MNSSHFVSTETARSGVEWLKRILQEPATFIILVWVAMMILVGVCFALTD